MGEEIVETIVETEKKTKIISCGLDIGTMNIVCAKSDSEEIKIMRNVFLELNPDEINISDLSDISYIENDGHIFIIGNDVFLFCPSLFAR